MGVHDSIDKAKDVSRDRSKWQVPRWEKGVNFMYVGMYDATQT